MDEETQLTELEAAEAETPIADEEPLLLDALLVEDVSIDGMCGVY